MNSVVRRSDDCTSGNKLVADGHAAREDLAGEEAADGGGHAHGFVDAGAEVGERGKGGSLADFLDVGECGADFLGDAGEGGGVADEVEEGGCHGCGGRVGAGDDAEGRHVS